MTCAAPFLAASLLAVSATAGSAAIWNSYIAPVNRTAFKVVTPGEEPRLFNQSDPALAGRMCSEDGWTATFGEDGLITVEAPDTGGAKSVWEFDRGRLVACASGGARKDMAYEAARAAPEGVLTPLAYYEFTPEYVKEQEERVLEGKWEGTGRLCFPYENPNHSGALYCQLALLALVLLLACRGKARVAASVALAAFFVCLVLTGSRGSLIGFMAGLLPVFAFRFRSLVRSRVFWCALGVAVAAVGCWFGWLHSDQLMRGFAAGGMDWSNAIRMDMLRVAPKMMVDAPDGWGFVGAGRAYFDWYQPLDNLFMTGSLMNDHLTILANTGWYGRCAYLFAVSSLLLLACSLAWRKGGFLPASVFLATVVMSCFNPMFAKIGLWVVPAVAAGCLVLWCFRERGRCLLLPVAVSVLLAVGLTGIIYWVGSRMEPADGLRVYATRRQVCVRGKVPSTWIVDDTQGALGGIFACKDVREYYKYCPDDPSVGYVRSIHDLPERGVRRLVLSGKAGNDWLLRLSEDPEAREHLPKEVLFISPPFAPSEIPGALFHFCRVRVIVGEFAARFQPEYATPRPYVEIVPGMERYILRWMEHIMEP